MIFNSNKLNRACYWPKKIVSNSSHLILFFSALFLSLSFYYGFQWYQSCQLNSQFRTKKLLLHPLRDGEYQKAYNVGLLRLQKNQQQLALKAFVHAEAADDEALRGMAKFEIANIYFDLSVQSSNIAAGGAHQQAVAYIELSREAYKGALRINPYLYEARYNLELLDRISPERRTQGWQAETDGVTLKPFKRNGTAMMRDNKRRGLP